MQGLHASVGAREVVRGVDLHVASGEVHVVMGPNGSGKSTLAHALMGRPGTIVTEGSIRIDGTELVGLPSWRRARAGLFLALQQPIEVPGVLLEATMEEALAGNASPGNASPGNASPGNASPGNASPGNASPGNASPGNGAVAERLVEEAAAIGFDERFLRRPLNVDLSGGERKRNEVVQLCVIRPKFAVLDEIDSGLDVDAVRAVSRRIERATSEWGLGVVAVTHFHRLLRELRADKVHVLVGGRIVSSGGPELAEELERTGYGLYGASDADGIGTAGT